jgi:hypothetical protein
MEKKQTAVNWLRGEAIKLIVQAMQGTLNEDTLEHQISQIVTKALQMEREQIQDAFYHGIAIDAYNVNDKWTEAEKYYEQTYGV